jgi:hypothetical protein
MDRLDGSLLSNWTIVDCAIAAVVDDLDCLYLVALSADGQFCDNCCSSGLLSDIVDAFADHLRPRHGADVEVVLFAVEVERTVSFVRPVLDVVLGAVTKGNFDLPLARFRHRHVLIVKETNFTSTW